MATQPVELFSIADRMSAAVRELKNLGIRVEVGDDFVTYLEHRNRPPERSSIYPMFDVGSSYIDCTNGFWICGFDENDDLIHTQAVRLLDLTNVSLATHLTRHRHKYITPNTTPDPDKTFFSGPSALDTISGRVAYHGDFWLRAKGLGGPRSQGATALLSQILLELTLQSWQPDYVFALVPKALAAKGAHLRYGYIHCEPGRWIGPDQQVTDEDHLIWMSSDDLAASLSLMSSVSQGGKTPRTKQIVPAEVKPLDELSKAANA